MQRTPLPAILSKHGLEARALGNGVSAGNCSVVELRNDGIAMHPGKSGDGGSLPLVAVLVRPGIR
jgi:hypothetical protein